MSNSNNNNGGENHMNGDGEEGGNGINIGMDLIQALLGTSLNATGTDQLDNVDDISGEYSSLNKTMDELNSFLDRWEERHDKLQDDIQDMLSAVSVSSESEQEPKAEGETEESNAGNIASVVNTDTGNESTCTNSTEKVKNEDSNSKDDSVTETTEKSQPASADSNLDSSRLRTASELKDQDNHKEDVKPL